MPVPNPTSYDSLFPLPLVPVEVMMLHDDWPDYPMSCGAKFTFQGKIDQAAYNQAVSMAVERQPLFRAVIRRSLRHQWVWQPAETPRRVEWLGDSPAVDFAAVRPYQLDREPGWRMWVSERDGFTKVYCECHHTCCDGAGGIAFMGDVFGFYAQIMAERDAGNHTFTFEHKDPLLLRRRGKFERKTLPTGYRALRSVTDVASHIGMAMQSIRPLAAHRTSVDAVTMEPRYASLRFDRAFFRQLRERSAAQNATLNDLLARDLFLVLRDWNRQHDPANSPGPLRIVVPMNLRTRVDLQMPSTNRLSYAFLTRDDHEMSSPQALLRTICHETKLIRRHRLPIAFLDQLRILKAARVGMRIVFWPNRCLATAVLSNVGDPTRRFQVGFPREQGKIRVGNLLLRKLSAMTPLRPLTRVAFFFNTYGNQLTLSARLDPRHFTHEDAVELLERMAVRLGATVPVRYRAAA